MNVKERAKHEREVFARFLASKKVVEVDEGAFVEAYSKLGVTRPGFSFGKKVANVSHANSGNKNGDNRQ